MWDKSKRHNRSRAANAMKPPEGGSAVCVVNPQVRITTLNEAAEAVTLVSHARREYGKGGAGERPTKIPRPLCFPSPIIGRALGRKD